MSKLNYFKYKILTLNAEVKLDKLPFQKVTISLLQQKENCDNNINGNPGKLRFSQKPVT